LTIKIWGSETRATNAEFDSLVGVEEIFEAADSTCSYADFKAEFCNGLDAAINSGKKILKNIQMTFVDTVLCPTLSYTPSFVDQACVTTTLMSFPTSTTLTKFMPYQ
jgi:hypothetical protein